MILLPVGKRLWCRCDCGIEFGRWQSLSIGRGEFCSTGCFDKSRTTASVYICKDCKRPKPAADFPVRKRGDRSLRNHRCRDCARARWATLKKAEYEKDPEPHRRAVREERARNGEHVRARGRIRRAKNPEHYRARDNAHRAKTLDRHRLLGRKWAERNLFRSRAKSLRALKLPGPCATAWQLARLWIRQRGICALTGQRLDRSAQVDHILAKSRGGTNEISNLRWVCKEVNLARRDLHDAEFIALCADVVFNPFRHLNKGALSLTVPFNGEPLTVSTFPLARE